VRLDDEKLFPPDGYEIQDETSGPDAPDLETIIIPLGFTQHGHGPVPSGSTITIMAVLLRLVDAWCCVDTADARMRVKDRRAAAL
jgi:choline dehydrogenase